MGGFPACSSFLFLEVTCYATPFHDNLVVRGALVNAGKFFKGEGR